MNATMIDTPPARPCGDCGSRAHWRQRRDEAWECGRCVRLPAPATDTNGLPEIMRHECSKNGCDLAADDEADAVPRPFVAEATVMTSGPLLLRCGCGRWARVLRVDAGGAVACERCADG